MFLPVMCLCRSWTAAEILAGIYSDPTAWLDLYAPLTCLLLDLPSRLPNARQQQGLLIKTWQDDLRSNVIMHAMKHVDADMCTRKSH